jgi:hypothetical protein
VDASSVSNERIKTTSVTSPVPAERNTYRYEEDPNLYNVNEQDHHNLKLYEERLVATKSRVKTGEVTISKELYIESWLILQVFNKLKLTFGVFSNSHAAFARSLRFVPKQC